MWVLRVENEFIACIKAISHLTIQTAVRFEEDSVEMLRMEPSSPDVRSKEQSDRADAILSRVFAGSKNPFPTQVVHPRRHPSMTIGDNGRQIEICFLDFS